MEAFQNVAAVPERGTTHFPGAVIGVMSVEYQSASNVPTCTRFELKLQTVAPTETASFLSALCRTWW